MTSRRRFLQAISAIPPSLALSPDWAHAAAPTADTSRLALIIGNNAYKTHPLENPVNDARAMANLFSQAGFTVDAELDATRTGMLGAIDRFGKAISNPEIKLVVFYYAGHGAQRDWRNYLIPVDADVASPEHLAGRCVDLNVLLGRMGKASNKTFIVILDACRDNPFGTTYRPEQKGLSQFDAPTDCLLAYATAPGSVASDGSAANGLYTGHLARELSVRGTRIEDALKRVRLNVRMASRGAQIPWETTSLESDVFLFKEDLKTLSAAEQEKILEAEIATWARIKASKNSRDWIDYLREFPNGRFSEIAQLRLSALLAEVEKPLVADAVAAGGTKPMPSPDQLQGSASYAIELPSAKSVPVLLPSTNPYSSGTYPLNRIFTIGDEAVFRQADSLTNIGLQISLRVTVVDADMDKVEINNGKVLMDLMGNLVKDKTVEFDAPRQFIPADFYVGKKWNAVFRNTKHGQNSDMTFTLKIPRREKIRVPAGEFDCFLIEGKGWNLSNGVKIDVKLWAIPGLNFLVKYESIKRNRQGQLNDAHTGELVSLRQHVFKAS